MIGAIIAGFLVGGATNNGFAGVAAGVEICTQRPELAVPISRINREYLTTREPVPMCFPTAKEWTRPESERR